MKLHDTYLEAARFRGDPLADRLMDRLFTSGQGQQVNKLLSGLHTNADYTSEVFKDLPADLTFDLIHYFDQTNGLPEWFDTDLFEQGQQVFTRHGPEIAFLLNVKSLPMCFACWRGAQALYRTGRMRGPQNTPDGLAKRLVDTSQMVINLLEPDSLTPGGQGVITIQKVRLIHAAVRYYLQKDEHEPWSESTLGLPINQEDMAGTLMSFSALVLDGLREIGVSLSPEEQEGYMHCWRIAGYYLGIEEDFLPLSYREGRELGLSIMKRQAGESEEARIMTANCVEFLKNTMPGRFFEDLPEYFIWYFMQEVSETIGTDLATILGVRDAGKGKGQMAMKLAFFASRKIGILDSHSELIRKLIITVKQEFMKGMLRYWGSPERAQFEIPYLLKSQWQIA